MNKIELKASLLVKKYILIFTSFLFLNSYSQSMDTIYFFISKKDTLIQKQITTKKNTYEGYRIIDKRRVVKDIKRSNSINGDDIEYDTFESFSFSFNRKNDTIISKSYIDDLKIVKKRMHFLDTIKNLNIFFLNFIFIEPKNCDRYIMRKVEILTFE